MTRSKAIGVYLLPTQTSAAQIAAEGAVRRKHFEVPDLCRTCAAGVHLGHTGVGCISLVAREPNDYVCRCGEGRPGGRLL